MMGLEWIIGFVEYMRLYGEVVYTILMILAGFVKERIDNINQYKKEK